MHTGTDPDRGRTARIVEIVAEHLELDPAEIGEGDLFVEDHGADSMALIDLLAALEREFRVAIDQRELPRMVDVRGVRAVLAEAPGW
ncbi:acyl carrier protein [Actinomadura parmotrematis]|uniref:Acyl carrier protein n=1 Tax=Actinomadura parmotrematis TaxID=2864039 RepID=A0ABS7G2W0_9ACTN|nr:acyl carrier protein [Actinomadura parmotrematis]MBW8487053.1 acyl carrier protein [Actinomadura parmotrematis]